MIKRTFIAMRLHAIEGENYFFPFLVIYGPQWISTMIQCSFIWLEMEIIDLFKNEILFHCDSQCNKMGFKKGRKMEFSILASSQLSIRRSTKWKSKEEQLVKLWRIYHNHTQKKASCGSLTTYAGWKTLHLAFTLRWT